MSALRTTDACSDLFFRDCASTWDKIDANINEVDFIEMNPSIKIEKEDLTTDPEIQSSTTDCETSSQLMKGEHDYFSSHGFEQAKQSQFADVEMHSSPVVKQNDIVKDALKRKLACEKPILTEDDMLGSDVKRKFIIPTLTENDMLEDTVKKIEKIESTANKHSGHYINPQSLVVYKCPCLSPSPKDEISALRSSTNILPESEILSIDAMRAERWNIIDLAPILQNKQTTIEWLVRRGLLHNSGFCKRCSKKSCNLIRVERSESGKQWQCSMCHSHHSIRNNSFFSNSPMPLSQLILFVYCWAVGWKQRSVSRESGILSTHILSKKNSVCRQVCRKYLEKHPLEIGGMDDTGEPIIVEILGPKLMIPNDAGSNSSEKGKWLFGGISRDTGNYFLVELLNSRENKLRPIIEKYVLPGSHIVTDDWGVNAVRDTTYKYSVVKQDGRYDKEINTQNAKNLWQQIEQKIAKDMGAYKKTFDEYLIEFMVRNMFRNEDPFSSFLICMRDVYSL